VFNFLLTIKVLFVKEEIIFKYYFGYLKNHNTFDV
jgi:hypothetical protein